MSSCLLGLLLAAVVGALFLEARNSAQIPQSLHQQAQTIWQAHAERILHCPSSVSQTDHNIATALVAIELDAATDMERFLERSVVGLSDFFGTALPDWSLGIAQLRPSTLVDAGLLNKGDRRAVSVMATNDCAAMEYAQQLVAILRLQCPATLANDTCQFSVARSYNGQVTLHSANLAYLTVFEALLRSIERGQNSNPTAPVTVSRSPA